MSQFAKDTAFTAIANILASLLGLETSVITPINGHQFGSLPGIRTSQIAKYA